MSDFGNSPAEGDAASLNARSGNQDAGNAGSDSKFIPNDTAANVKLVEASGWVARTNYDYKAAMATGADRTQAHRDNEVIRNVQDIQDRQVTEQDPGPGAGKNAEGIQALRDAQVADQGHRYDVGDKVEPSTLDIPLWSHSANKYEWKDEYGDVGPKVPELEQQLFNDQFLQRVGDNFKEMQIGNLEVTVESETEVAPIMTWQDAGLHPVMLENIALCRYTTPTAIQGYCVPAVLKNHDLVAISQTGSGKTAAYFIPILSKLMGKAKKLAARRPAPDEDVFVSGNTYRAEPLVLVVVPTRELAVQIFDEARRLCYRSMLRPCVVYGGGPRREQLFELKRGCDVLIGTPGRLKDFMSDGGLLSMSRVRYTILDEADELVGPDWADDIKVILTGGDANQDADHRYMMFSATFPKDARALAKEHLADDHVRLRIGRIGSTHRNVTQVVIWVEEEQKQQALFDLLLSMPPARTIVFVNSRRAADFLDDFLFNHGMPSTSMHADRTQREREDSLRSFKSGKTPILVATGISARGWDVWNVMHVVNYDIPSSMHGGINEYVHRIGRTGRIGNRGHATSFYNDRNEDMRESLINILLESKQPLPDFFEEFRPAAGQALDFNDDDDDEAGRDGGDDSWGAGNDGNMENGTTGDGGWGAGPVDSGPGGAGGWGAGPVDSGPGGAGSFGGW